MRLVTVKPLVVALTHRSVGAVGVAQPCAVTSRAAEAPVSLNEYLPFFLKRIEKVTAPLAFVLADFFTLPVSRTVAAAMPVSPERSTPLMRI